MRYGITPDNRWWDKYDVQTAVHFMSSVARFDMDLSVLFHRAEVCLDTFGETNLDPVVYYDTSTWGKDAHDKKPWGLFTWLWQLYTYWYNFEPDNDYLYQIVREETLVALYDDSWD